MSETTTDATATSVVAADGTGGPPNNNVVFNDEDEMMRQLQAMGMPRQMLENLTSKQKAAMFALTKSPEIQRRAEERVAHDEEWKELAMNMGGGDGGGDNNNNKPSGEASSGRPDPAHGGGGTSSIMWKNTRDDVFCKFTLSKSTAKRKEQVQCNISSNHLQVVILDGNNNSTKRSSKDTDGDDDQSAVVIVDHELFQSVDADESTYTVEEKQDGGNGDGSGDGNGLVIVVSLRKKQIPMRWLTVFR